MIGEDPVNPVIPSNSSLAFLAVQFLFISAHSCQFVAKISFATFAAPFLSSWLTADGSPVYPAPSPANGGAKGGAHQAHQANDKPPLLAYIPAL